MKNRILGILLLWMMASAVPAGKFQLKEGPLEHKGGTVIIENGLVAVSEAITVKSSSTSSILSSASIMFVIDHSRSMYDMQNTNPTGQNYDPDGGMDRLGNRYAVARALIDTLSNTEKFPGVEVGLTVFSADLCFNPTNKDTVVLKQNGSR